PLKGFIQRWDAECGQCAVWIFQPQRPDPLVGMLINHPLTITGTVRRIIALKDEDRISGHLESVLNDQRLSLALKSKRFYRIFRVTLHGSSAVCAHQWVTLLVINQKTIQIVRGSQYNLWYGPSKNHVLGNGSSTGHVHSNQPHYTE